MGKICKSWPRGGVKTRLRGHLRGWFAWVLDSTALRPYKTCSLGILAVGVLLSSVSAGPDCLDVGPGQTLQIFTQDGKMRLVRLIDEEGQTLLEMSGEVVINVDKDMAENYDVPETWRCSFVWFFYRLKLLGGSLNIRSHNLVRCLFHFNSSVLQNFLQNVLQCSQRFRRRLSPLGFTSVWCWFQLWVLAR